MKGGKKVATGYRIPPDVTKKIDAIILAKEYSNRAEIITTALRFWLDNRDKTPKDQIIEWLKSDEGEQYIETVMNRIAAKKK
ncbi:type II toxin-antitoxin system ParD family antitoxin [uncultured Methanoregula sp.]|uniref:ribbon-helix-helix domain-containing protein n=1 Tax=uncultured Methanoregula sp. TaxID=1005933 RepID=UPI003747A1DA